MEILKILRANEGLNQRDMAKKLNIAKSTYAHYESGRSEPDISTLKKLSDFFNCSVDYLIGHKVQDITKTKDATPLQRTLCADILSFDEEDCMRVEAFMEGLKSARKEQKQSKNSNIVDKTE